MADGAQTTLTGPAAKVAAFVNSAIARIKREAQTAVDSAVQQARADIDRIAREAADTALAEARAASAEAQQARADMAAMQDEMNATRDEIREMLAELKRRQAEHDEMFASFDDLDGDGVPDHLQAESTEIAVAPQTAPVVHDPRWSAEELKIIAGHLADALRAGQISLAPPANDSEASTGVIVRDNTPYLVTDRQMQAIVEVGLNGQEIAFNLQPIMFQLLEVSECLAQGDLEEAQRLLSEIEWEEDTFEEAWKGEVKAKIQEILKR